MLKFPPNSAREMYKHMVKSDNMFINNMSKFIYNFINNINYVINTLFEE